MSLVNAAVAAICRAFVDSTAVTESLKSSITYAAPSGAGYNITYTFDATAHPSGVYCWQFADGSWGCRPDAPGGTVTISSITPAQTGSAGTFRNGTVVNPATMLGIDGRYVGYNAGFTDADTLTITPATDGTSSIVKIASGASSTPCVQFAAVLTVMDSKPSVQSFRPGYANAVNKTAHPVSVVDTTTIPAYSGATIDTLKSTLPIATVKSQYANLRLDDGAYTGRACHPIDAYTDSYGISVANENANALIRFTFDDFTWSGDYKQALINYLQYAIDLASLLQYPNYNLSSTVTFDATTNLMYWPAHGFTDPHTTCTFTSTGTLPAEITSSSVAGSKYYLKKYDADHCYVCSTVGTPLDLTTAGSGTITATTQQKTGTGWNYVAKDIVSSGGFVWRNVQNSTGRFNPCGQDTSYWSRGALFWADGGHCVGRKGVLIAASKIMPSIASTFTTAISKHEQFSPFHEDGQVFTSTVRASPASNQVLWGRRVSTLVDLAEVLSITRSGGTATVTTKYSNSLVTGDFAEIYGANQAEYNINKSITVTGGAVFTMAVSGTPATPATPIPGIKVYADKEYWQNARQSSGSKDVRDPYQYIDGGAPIYESVAKTIVKTAGSNTITIAEASNSSNLSKGMKMTGTNFGTNPAYVGAVSNDGVNTTITVTTVDLVTANNAAASGSVSVTFYHTVNNGDDVAKVGTSGSYQQTVSAAYKGNALALRMLYGIAAGSAVSAWGNDAVFTYADRWVTTGTIANNDGMAPFTIAGNYKTDYGPDKTGAGRVPNMHGLLADTYGGYNNTFVNSTWTYWASH